MGRRPLWQPRRVNQSQIGFDQARLPCVSTTATRSQPPSAKAATASSTVVRPLPCRCAEAQRSPTATTRSTGELDPDLAVLDADIVQQRPLAGIVVDRPQRADQRRRVELFRPRHHPAAEMVRSGEMRVVCGAGREPPPLGEQKVKHGRAVAPIALHRRDVGIDFYGMRRLDPSRIVERQPVPLRMRDGDEGAGLGAAHCQRLDAFARLPAGEVGHVRPLELLRQACRQQVPDLAVRQPIRMHLGAEDRRERVRPERRGVSDRIAVAADQMVRQADEIVALDLIATADLLERQRAVRQL